jgi:ketosteroid isomerase-like protein
MSQENVEVVRAYFDAANAGDFSRVMTYYADDVKLQVRSGFIELGTYKGREEVGRWFGEWFRSFRRGWRFEFEEVTDLGPDVLVAVGFRAQGKASGAEIQGKVAYHLYRLEEGMIVGLELFGTRVEALEAAGLSE